MSSKNASVLNNNKKMAASWNRFSNISEEEVDNLINDAIPEKTKPEQNMEWRFSMVSGNNKSKLITINDWCFRKGFCLQIFLG